MDIGVASPSAPRQAMKNSAPHFFGAVVASPLPCMLPIMFIMDMFDIIESWIVR